MHVQHDCKIHALT